MGRIKATLTVEIELNLDPTDYDIDGVVTPKKVLAAERSYIEEDLNGNTGYLIESIEYAAESGNLTFKSLELKDEE